jgi:hypothetical protein
MHIYLVKKKKFFQDDVILKKKFFLTWGVVAKFGKKSSIFKN